MSNKEFIRQLKIERERKKDKHVHTGEIRWCDLLGEVIKRMEKLLESETGNYMCKCVNCNCKFFSNNKRSTVCEFCKGGGK